MVLDSRTETYRKIRQKLLAGSIRSPKDLSRRKLASLLNETPGNVQWALARMEAEGVLQTRPQSGTFVRQLTPREFRNLHDIRKLIEPYAAARSARLITSDLLARLEQTVQEMALLTEDIARTTTDRVLPEIVERIIRLETTFHGTILEAAQNPEATRIVEHAQLFTHLTRYFPAISHAVLLADARMSLAGHRAILDAIRLGNAKLARRRMKAHITAGFTMIQPQPTSEEATP